MKPRSPEHPAGESSPDTCSTNTPEPRTRRADRRPDHCARTSLPAGNRWLDLHLPVWRRLYVLPGETIL